MPAPKSINELLDALKSAPQDKEGAFRVATWRMVLQEFANMQTKLLELEKASGLVEKKIVSISASTPDVESIVSKIKDDITKADSSKVLF